MKTISLLCITAFSCMLLHAQSLIPNGSFENDAPLRFEKTDTWTYCIKGSAPDYFSFNPNLPVNNVFDKYAGGINPHTGNCFVGMFCYRTNPLRLLENAREAIQVKLTQPLIKDSLYKLHFFAARDDESNASIKCIDVAFAEKPFTLSNEKGLFKIKNKWAVFFPIKMSGVWQSMELVYKATGKEQYMLLANMMADTGSFNGTNEPVIGTDKLSKWNIEKGEQICYYYFDDFSLYPMFNTEQPQPKPQPKLFAVNYDITEIKTDSAIIIQNIAFEFNKSVLLPESYIQLKSLLSLMQLNKQIEIKIEGHTDSIGNYDYNLNLSAQRAQAVANYLIDSGIDYYRIWHLGRGYTCPIAPNNTEENRVLNRRVTFKVIKK